MPDQLGIGSRLAGMATNAHLNVDPIGRFKSLSASACTYIWEPSLTIHHQKLMFIMTQIKSLRSIKENDHSHFMDQTWATFPESLSAVQFQNVITIVIFRGNFYPQYGKHITSDLK